MTFFSLYNFFRPYIFLSFTYTLFIIHFNCIFCILRVCVFVLFLYSTTQYRCIIVVIVVGNKNNNTVHHWITSLITHSLSLHHHHHQHPYIIIIVCVTVTLVYNNSTITSVTNSVMVTFWQLRARGGL